MQDIPRKTLLVFGALVVAAVLTPVIILLTHQSPEREEPVKTKNPATVSTVSKPEQRLPGRIPDPATSQGFGAKTPSTSEQLKSHSISSHAVKPLQLDFTKGPFERRADGSVLKKDTQRRALELHKEDQPPEEDIAIVDSIINQYRRIFGENPIAGENKEIVSALTGQNPYNLVFIDPTHPGINERGELTDRWGTPFSFHAVSSKQPVEIASAGPDKVIGSFDDIRIEEPQVIGHE
ncbi:MAG: hypothetical protein AAGA58_00925 [Verrucomicrobiota bacterium]